MNKITDIVNYFVINLKIKFSASGGAVTKVGITNIGEVGKL